MLQLILGPGVNVRDSGMTELGATHIVTALACRPGEGVCPPCDLLGQLSALSGQGKDFAQAARQREVPTDSGRGDGWGGSRGA